MKSNQSENMSYNFLLFNKNKKPTKMPAFETVYKTKKEKQIKKLKINVIIC